MYRVEWVENGKKKERKIRGETAMQVFVSGLIDKGVNKEDIEAWEQIS